MMKKPRRPGKQSIIMGKLQYNEKHSHRHNDKGDKQKIMFHSKCSSPSIKLAKPTSNLT